MSEMMPSSVERFGLKEKLKNFLRPALLAAALGSSSLVAIGCDKSKTNNAPESSNTPAPQVEQGGGKLSKSQNSERIRAMREEVRREQHEQTSETNSEIHRAGELAEKKGISLGANAEINFKAVGGVPIKISANGVEVPLEADDFTPEEIHHIQSAYRLSRDPAVAKILNDIGISLQETNQRQAPSSTQEKTTTSQPASGVRMGTDFPATDF
jgi:hypothetical protein